MFSKRWFQLCIIGHILLTLLSCATTQPQPTVSATRPPVPAESQTAMTVDSKPLPVADEPPTAPMPTATLPFDPAVVHGTLDNGLEYFIRKNQKPESRAQLWLAIDAGSILEDEDQLGLAHFVEHMAFNGTESFEKQEIVEFLEEIGMTFGPDVNAYTSFDETVYMLNLPTDDPEILEKGFKILREWASKVSFDPEEVDKERGVVLEEWRRGRGASARLRDVHFPVILAGSRYAERRTIGDPDIIQNAPVEALKRYYEDWYRPDLMAVIAVGDFDPSWMEAQLKASFADLENPENPRERTSYGVPNHADVKISIASDPEQTTASASIYDKRKATPLQTQKDYRHLLLRSLYARMMGGRFSDILQKPDAPFLYAGASLGGFVRGKDAFSTRIASAPEKIGQALAAARKEIQRAAQHGFSETEFERAKAAMMRSYEQLYRERDKRRSSSLANEILNYFLEDEAMPGIAWEREFVERTLPEIQRYELQARASEWAIPQNRVIEISLPEQNADVIDKAEVLSLLEDTATAKLEPWVDDTKDGPLVPNPPSPGKVVSTRSIPEIETTVWTLSNGAEVWLKPTDFQNDQILFTAFSDGGSSLAPDESDGALLADLVASVGGAGQFSDAQLDKALAGKRVRLSSSISTYEQGFSGSASPEDLEVMLQLLWLRATAPRFDSDAIEANREQIATFYENRLADPRSVYNDAFTEHLYDGHPRTIPWTVERIKAFDSQQGFDFYKDRMKSPGNMTFFFVGNLDLETIRPLVEQWIAPLPSGEEESWKDLGIRPVREQRSFEVLKGIEPKSSVRYTWYGDATWSPEESHLVRSLRAALSIRLREILREDMGGTYGVSVSGSLSRRPVESFSFTFSFQCAPEKAEELVAAAMAELDRISKEGVDETVIQKVKEAQRRDRETDLKENGFWRNVLTSAVRYDRDPLEVYNYDALIDSVTVESMKKTASKYLDRTHSVLGILYPENHVKNDMENP